MRYTSGGTIISTGKNLDATKRILSGGGRSLRQGREVLRLNLFARGRRGKLRAPGDLLREKRELLKGNLKKRPRQPKEGDT